MLEKLIHTYFLTNKRIFHVAGGAATGKSLLIQNSVIYDIKQGNSPARTYYIVDTESKHSNRLYKSLEKRDQQRIKVVTETHPHRFLELLHTLSLPGILNKGDVLIIDSISKFVKDRFLGSENYYEWKAEYEWFTTQFIPMLFRILVKSKINVVLVYHSAYKPDLGGNFPHYADIFRQLKGPWVVMRLDKLRIPVKYEGQVFFDREGIANDGVPVKTLYHRKFEYKIGLEGEIITLQYDDRLDRDKGESTLC